MNANGARPKNSMQSRRKYGILAPEEPVGDLATAGPWVRGSGHRATKGAAEQGRMDTETGDKTGQRALLARDMQEGGDEERIPNERSCTLNACANQGGGGG